MKQRFKTKPKQDKKVFTNTADKTHRKNIARQNAVGIMRGGYRI